MTIMRKGESGYEFPVLFPCVREVSYMALRVPAVPCRDQSAGRRIRPLRKTALIGCFKGIS